MYAFIKIWRQEAPEETSSFLHLVHVADSFLYTTLLLMLLLLMLLMLFCFCVCVRVPLPEFPLVQREEGLDQVRQNDSQLGVLFPIFHQERPCAFVCPGTECALPFPHPGGGARGGGGRLVLNHTHLQRVHDR